MERGKDIRVVYEESIMWIEILRNVENEIWKQPIAAGKWSVGEVVSHLMNWDRYLLSHILPAVRKGEEMNFPPFDEQNEIASQYAKSGVSKEKLIDETIEIRKKLVQECFEMKKEVFYKSLPCNGVTHCPHTGTPYSLSYIIEEFAEHDNHHKKQIQHIVG